jgi:hypothetical protein
MSHAKIGSGEPDDGCLVQLGGNCRGKRKQSGQILELEVLLLTSIPRCILALFLHIARVGTGGSCGTLAPIRRRCPVFTSSSNEGRWVSRQLTVVK